MMEAGIDALGSALTELTLERSPVQWISARVALGGVLAKLGGQLESAELLREAIKVLDTVLEQRHLSSLTAEVTGVDYNRTMAVTKLGRLNGDTDMLREAIAADRAQLTVVTRRNEPDVWAHIQNSLGSTLYDLGGIEDDVGHFLNAANAFMLALEVGPKNNSRFNTLWPHIILVMRLQRWANANGI
jgi:tetratricopeptide (TPR) repeat protein